MKTALRRPMVIATAGRIGAEMAAKAPLICKLETGMERIRKLVSIDRRLSPTGLYAQGRNDIRPVEDLDGAEGPLLARTDGLTLMDKRALWEMDVPIMYVREVPGACGMTAVEAWYPKDIPGLTEEARRTREEQRERLDNSEGPVPDAMGMGTVVVPYLVLNRVQARAVLEEAERMPMPVEERPARAAAQENVPAACWWGFPGC